MFTFRSLKFFRRPFYKAGGAFGYAFTATAGASVVVTTHHHYLVGGAFHSIYAGPMVHNPNSPVQPEL